MVGKKESSSYEGSLVRLRPVEATDLECSYAWHNDPETRDNVLGHPFPVTWEAEENWLSQLNEDGHRRRVTFSIETRQKRALAGFVHFTEIDWVGRVAKFGIVIGAKAQRGIGLGRETTSLALDYAFETLNLKRVWLLVVDFNATAIDLYAKLGFRREGALRQHAFVKGAYRDVIAMGLLREEYRERKAKAGRRAS